MVKGELSSEVAETQYEQSKKRGNVLTSTQKMSILVTGVIMVKEYL